MDRRIAEEEFRKHIKQNMEDAERERDEMHKQIYEKFKDMTRRLEERRNGTTSSIKFPTIEESSKTAK